MAAIGERRGPHDGKLAAGDGTSWLAHEDIDDVMLATSVEPKGFLVLPPMRLPS